MLRADGVFRFQFFIRSIAKRSHSTEYKNSSSQFALSSLNISFLIKTIREPRKYIYFFMIFFLCVFWIFFI